MRNLLLLCSIYPNGIDKNSFSFFDKDILYIKNIIYFILIIFKTQIIYNELGKKQKCDTYTFQSYDTQTLGLEQKHYYISEISKRVNCMKSSVFRNRKLDTQQTLYASMRRNPEKYPIISSVKNMNLTLAQQRNYSNLWYRQFGTSQGLPVNDNFGGFYCVGSDVPYTN